MYIYNLCILWIRHVENLGQSQKKKKKVWRMTKKYEKVEKWSYKGLDKS